MIQAGLKRLRDERSGNFSIMAALAAVPLLMGVGMALDYATMSRVRAELQQATDAAVLAVAREGQNITQAEADRIARNFLTATLNKPFDRLEVWLNAAEVTVSARVDSGRQFGTFFGFKDNGIQTASTAVSSMPTYEIGLVLDTTGSMNEGGKLADMRAAATQLVNNLTGGRNNPSIRFALVPFANFVNVGAQHGPRFDKDGKQIPGDGAAWLDLKGAVLPPQAEFDAKASRFQLYQNLGKTWPGCVETRYSATQNYDISDAPPSQADPTSLFVPALWPDERKEGFINNYSRLYGKDSRGQYTNELVVDPNSNVVSEKKKVWNKYRVASDGGASNALSAAPLGCTEDIGGLQGRR